MTTKLKFHWQFTENEGRVAQDTVSGAKGKLHQTIKFQGHGRIGNAIRLPSKESRFVLGNTVGQFGSSDFTIAFGIKITNTHKQNDLDIIGNRKVRGHSNWFSLRLEDKGRILTFEVDENNKGKNYAVAKTPRLPLLSNKKWHHIALVREGRTLRVYVDGLLEAEGTSKTGVANINNSVDMKVGHWTRHTPSAQYEDLRIYNAALSAVQIQNLIPPVNRLLRKGEIELVATDDASIILKQDRNNLARFSTQFKQLRLGPGTGATLYKGADFGGVAQKLFADIPNIKDSKLRAFPRSVEIWPTAEESFTGNWIIKTPNGQYLSRSGTSLTTAPKRLRNELFAFRDGAEEEQPGLASATAKKGQLLKVDGVPSALLIDDSENHKDAFSIVHPSQNQWLRLNQNKTFSWTTQRERRSLFHRVAKLAANEGQVGQLAPGEVALYEHTAYHGKTWILSDSTKDRSGNFTNFTEFQDLNDKTSSIRLGPDTAVTLFKHVNNRVNNGKRETEIQDLVENEPDLRKAQIGNDTISSIKIFKTVEPQNLFTSFTSKLSQDYRMVGDKMEEFSSYRTILRFEPGAGEVEVSATDLTKIEVDDVIHQIDESRSVTLKPNAFNLIMITSEADGLSTPGLKFRTSDMAENERVVIFPDQEAHQQIAELDEDALWNATDAQGQPVVDRSVHEQSEVASVQRTIQRAMASVVYNEEAPVAAASVLNGNGVVSAGPANQALSRQAVNGVNSIPALNGQGDVLSTNRLVTGAENPDPWILHFTRQPTLGKGLVGANNIWQEQIDQNDFVEIRGVAVDVDAAAGAVNGIAPAASPRSARGLFSGIKKAFKKAKSVVVGVVNDAINILVDIGEQVVSFVLDTAKKVADFVEAVVEKVVKGIKQFIEFLQFLFNWDDILATQQYLVNTVNGALGFAAQLAQDAKPHVSAFVDNLQDTVEDGMNELVTMLGGDPSEVKDSGFKLPEAAEWFLSKLTGGSKKSGADAKPSVGGDPSEDSPLESFMRHFFEAFEDALGAAIRLPEGFFESVLSLITNPRKPERALIVLIEAFRDAIIQSLEAMENVALGILDVASLAADLFQKLLNAEIKIPFISDLFEFVGAGKLTMLNLSTVLLAIPITVVSKIMFNERPFKDAAPINFSTQPKARLVTAVSQAGPDEGAPQDSESSSSSGLSDREKSIRDWGLVSMLALFFKGLVNFRLDVVSESLDEGDELTAGFGMEFISLLLDFFIWLGSFPSSPSFPGGRPYDIIAENKNGEARNGIETSELVMWSFRTIVFWLDLIVLVGSPILAIKTKDPKIQRMKRREELTIGVFFILSLVDLAYTSIYLSKLPKGGEKKTEIAYQVLSQIPNSFGLLRLIPEPNGTIASVALAAIDLGAGSFATMAGLAHVQDKLDAFEAEAVPA